MKIVRSLDVSPEEFFAYVEQGIADEFEKASGKRLPEGGARPGLSFALGGSGAQSVRMHVVENDGRARFATRVCGPGVDNAASYLLEKDGDKTRVTFEQELSDFNARKRGAVRTFSEAVYLGRMADSLYSAETAIKAARNGEAVPTARQPRRVEDRADVRFVRKLATAVKEKIRVA